MADSIKTLGTSLLGILLISTGGLACDLAPVAARQTPAQSPAAGEQAEPSLQIENQSDLPDTYPHASYTLHFQARGGVPVLHWRVEKGALPPGMKLEENGLLHGAAERTGEFQFTLAVRDGGQPQSGVQKAFTLRVRSALSLRWKTLAHVNGNRIEGSVEVSNTTADDIDLTFIVMAVAGNGRANAIGYQHFVLRGGTAMELPFGDTLPHGGYVVNIDAVGEVPPKNLIYRDRMVTPTALQVTVGP